MAKLLTLPFPSAGVAGLNIQASNATLGQEWATVMNNAVVDENGRMALRAGTKELTTNDTTNAIETIFTSIQSNGDTHTHVADAGGLVYNNATLSTTMADLSGVATLAVDGNYKYQNFNNKVVAWHRGGAAIVQATATGNFADIVFALHTPSGVNDILALDGRLWAVTNTHLYWSNLLDETTWRTSGTATDAGFLELNNVWPGGRDVGVALAEFNGNLVIFGERSTVIYADPVDPNGSGFIKTEAIEGTGCIQRNSVQNIGRDLVWMSNSGLKTLGRVIQEKSMPLIDVLPQVRDHLLGVVTTVDEGDIKSAYAENLGLYVVTTPSETIVVNVKNTLPDGSFRVTHWDTFAACGDNGAGGLFLSLTKKVMTYTGAKDGVDSGGNGGTALGMEYESGWLDFDSALEGAALLVKYLKSLKASVRGGAAATLQFKWVTDYKTSFNSQAVLIPNVGSGSRYGTASYGSATYGADVSVSRIGATASRSGQVVKIGFSLVGATSAFALNRIDLYAKIGKQL